MSKLGGTNGTTNKVVSVNDIPHRSTGHKSNPNSGSPSLVMTRCWVRRLRLYWDSYIQLCTPLPSCILPSLDLASSADLVLMRGHDSLSPHALEDDGLCGCSDTAKRRRQERGHGRDPSRDPCYMLAGRLTDTKREDRHLNYTIY